MSVQSLVPAKSTQGTAIKAFMRSMSSENLSNESINVAILDDSTGNTLVAIMDKFALYLALNKSKQGKYSARNSVLSYCRQVKKWLLGLFNSQKAVAGEKLLEMAQTLDKDCLKRERGGMAR